ncbi:MAG TPA: dockerin type I domain-containing protein [Oscillatoriaceae cyanobacterium]
MGDEIYKKLAKVSAKEIADSLEGKVRLDARQTAAADVNGDGVIDEKDAEMLADAELKLANKISGVIVGMGTLTDEEKAVADRNGDGHVNLTDSQRLADDARKAKAQTAKLKFAKKQG